jgi:DNA-directed RNA polymerase subunit RPC12/RpoP
MPISCPNYNEKVSDKAHVCPHCGFRIDTLSRCLDCGQLVRFGTIACLERSRLQDIQQNGQKWS